MLCDTRLVITGDAGPDGLGAAVARRALLLGAHVTLVAPPPLLAGCRDLAEGLPRGAHAVCADLTRPDDVAALREHLRCAYGSVDGAVHAAEEAGSAGARALTALAGAVAGLLPDGGGSLVALAPPGDPERPSALEAAARDLAGTLGAAGARVNVVAAGPRSPLRAADAACFLLSSRAQGTTGQVLHVGGSGRARAAAAAGRP